MIKNLTGGAVISYGPTLPTSNSTYDGGMFYKNFGSDQGLYVFSFTQDANGAVLGDQVQQSWTQVQSPGLYVNKTGDTITGALAITGGGSTADPYGRMSVTLPGDSNSYGYFGLTRQAQVGWTIGIDTSNRLFFGNGAGILNNAASRFFTFAQDGTFQANGNTFWHAGNDGAGSALDAGLFAGQPPSFYSNAGNITAGTLSQDRLPFVPVQQGGGTGQAASKVYIGWGGAQLLLQVDSTNFAATWPISISGQAGFANSANSATNATNAVDATSARYLRQGGLADGTNMTFNWAGQGGQPPWLWGGSDGSNMYVYNPSNFSVAYATTAGSISGGVAWTSITGRPTALSQFTNDGFIPNTLGINHKASDGSVLFYFGGNGNIAYGSGGGSHAFYGDMVGANDLTARNITATGTGVSNTGKITADRFFANGGTAALPGFSLIEGANDTGLYSGGDGFLNFASNGAYAGNFAPGGHFTAAGNITAFSDRRLKTNIEVIPDALEKVKALRGVTFTRVADDSRATGLIAQDVLAVLPEAVMGSEESMYSVAYGNLVGLLVESIKELSDQVQALKADIETLKGQ